MKIQEIKMEGPFKIHTIDGFSLSPLTSAGYMSESTAPTGDDAIIESFEGNILYNKEDESLYYGDYTEWKRISTLNLDSVVTIADDDTLSSIISDIGANNRTIIIEDAIVEDGTVTIPSNVTLKFLKGGIINGTGNLTINGYISADPFQCFGMDLTLEVAGQSKVNASWFYDFNTAVNAVGTNEVDLIIGESMLVDGDITIPDNINLVYSKAGFVDSAIQSLRNGDYQWSLSLSGNNEYYVESAGGGDPDIEYPGYVYENGTKIPEGTLEVLNPGEWAWGDSEGLGYDTLYVRLSDDADPDTKAEDYIEKSFIMTLNASINPRRFKVIGDNLVVIDNSANDLSSINGSYIGEIRINDGTSGSIGPYWWDSTAWVKMDDWTSTITPS